ncbi:hypothetical protein F7725_020290 [Dissostichus mawsoni]|uniref:Uncharacterized protein n=1 Tax=Dissostichus mawsoni TaxID=36200 RepID=A0A7J5YCS8_DISMA|nr:hypothetical protein F7725_020290 [Dissostichus mawsoni]
MSTFLLVVGAVVGIAYLFRHIVVKGKQCTSSNTGIGKSTAIDLAKRGARVILACRSVQRGQAALEEVKRESGSNQVVFMPLDLGSLKSVRSFAENFLKSEPRLDILINNAGIFVQARTEDGLGMMFGVNHIGHFLLTNLLLDRLKECGPSRVVSVSSAGHNFGKINFDCLNTHKALGIGTSSMEVFQFYCDSKLCNVLFTHELAKRLKGTKATCYSLHPVLQMLLKPMTVFFWKNTVQGSQTTLHCALQEGIEPLNGRYFSNCTVRELYAKAKDDAAAKKLWELSERLCGLA